MPRVSCFDVKKGTTIEKNVTDKVWKRITQVPSVFGANKKWKLVPMKTPGAQPQFDTGAKHPEKVNDDQGEPNKVIYGEEAYKYDCEQGKKLFKSGEHQKALEFLTRASKFQPKNQYVRRLIKEINENQTNG